LPAEPDAPAPVQLEEQADLDELSEEDASALLLAELEKLKKRNGHG
jgi:hypothetical protein